MINFKELNHIKKEDMAVVPTARKGSYTMSIVNTSRNGRRAKLSLSLLESLGNPKSFQFAFDDEDYLIIGETIPGATERVKFSAGADPNIAYDTSFVVLMSKKFGLDFSTRTSICFREIVVERQDYEGKEVVYARINMRAISA